MINNGTRKKNRFSLHGYISVIFGKARSPESSLCFRSPLLPPGELGCGLHVFDDFAIDNQEVYRSQSSVPTRSKRRISRGRSLLWKQNNVRREKYCGQAE